MNTWFRYYFSAFYGFSGYGSAPSGYAISQPTWGSAKPTRRTGITKTPLYMRTEQRRAKNRAARKARKGHR